MQDVFWKIFYAIICFALSLVSLAAYAFGAFLLTGLTEQNPVDPNNTAISWAMIFLMVGVGIQVLLYKSCSVQYIKAKIILAFYVLPISFFVLVAICVVVYTNNHDSDGSRGSGGGSSRSHSFD